MINWNSDFDYAQIQTHQFDHLRLQEAFNRICRYLRPGVIDPDYHVLMSDYDIEANAATIADSLLGFISDLESGRRDENIGAALQPTTR